MGPTAERFYAQVARLIALKTKQSYSDSIRDSDPLPTSMVLALLLELLPILSDIVNKSLQSGGFPEAFKTALVRPSYKKKGLDPDELTSYRPISNLSFLSKLVEKCAAVQLSKHLEANNLLPDVQSAYRPNHSTETALL